MNETLEQKRLAITCCSSSNRPRKPESEAIRDAFFFQSAAQRLSPTLPLSGRQGACGGTTECWWWPVHSRGLLAGELKTVPTMI